MRFITSFSIMFLIILVFIITSFSPKSFAASSTVAYNAYSTTNATTSAYTTLISLTLAASSTFFVCDTSGHFIKLAVGAAGSEVDITGAPVSGCAEIETGKIIPINSRISFRALDATVSTGGLMVSLSR